jgi:Protein of unknown function (DUF938)
MTAMTASPATRYSAAAERNQAAILAQLQRLLPARGRLLEIAAGTGQHAVHCAAALPGWTWQPTDPSAEAVQSIAAWSAQQPSPGLLPPLQLDVLADRWPVAGGGETPWQAVYCANLLHIAPWACCAALMRGAAQQLAPDGQLITYGPYLVADVATSPGNLAFDADLRARNPLWGLRWLHDVVAEAAAAGLHLQEQVAMPANNRLLVFRRAAPPA